MFARDPDTIPEVSPNCFDKGTCFYLVLASTRPVINAGFFEVEALIVFKTTYLSYECFIQETKCEHSEWEPQEDGGTENSCMVIMALERGKETES